MKILWNSSVPFCQAGYGQATREIVRRMVKDGHSITIATKHPFVGTLEWEGVEIFEGLNFQYTNNILERENFDYIITFWDIWSMHKKMHYPHDKWIAYVPIDTEWISKRYAELLLGEDSEIEANAGPSTCIAMTKHGVRELKSIGIEPFYIPLGVETEVFKPRSDFRKDYRAQLGYKDDEFVIGSVGLNYLDDRKGYIQLLIAFKEFLKTHPEARLYLHTSPTGRRENGLNYAMISEYLGLYEYVLFANHEALDLQQIDREALSKIYSIMDVFCLPSKGEGFGFPIVEAASCGIPVITSSTTVGMEFHEAGIAPWIMDVSSIDNLWWLPTITMRQDPRPTQILECLETAYNAWKLSDYDSLKQMVRENALVYDWDVVFSKYWQPILKMLEEKKDANG